MYQIAVVPKCNGLMFSLSYRVLGALYPLTAGKLSPPLNTLIHGYGGNLAWQGEILVLCTNSCLCLSCCALFLLLFFNFIFAPGASLFQASSKLTRSFLCHMIWRSLFIILLILFTLRVMWAERKLKVKKL